MDQHKTISVGPFEILDLPRVQAVKLISGQVGAKIQNIFFALHVGGLNHRNDAQYVESMHRANGVYADGASAVILARLVQPNSKIERSATTDIAWEVIELSSIGLGRNIRVALIGGEPGVAKSAGFMISQRSNADVCYVSSGFRIDWDKVLSELEKSEPDLVFIGLGSPFEVKWVIENKLKLPKATIMTCGGWFGFVTGHEKRAPMVMQNAGFEWIWRAFQSPRLIARYLKGARTVGILALEQLRNRLLKI